MLGSKLHLGGAVVIGAFLAMPGALFAQQTPAKQVTFSKDVAPIFQSKCQSCHEPGSIGPMSLATYQDARPWARSIKNRFAYLDPLNHLQVELLKRHRATAGDNGSRDERVQRGIQLSINGIAAGLRNTG